MAKWTLLLLGFLVTCSVWTADGMSSELDLDDEEHVDLETSAEIPGTCWACKRALGKALKFLDTDADNKAIKKVLESLCSKLGPFKSACRNIVKMSLREILTLIKKGAKVRAICVKIKACKPKELMDLMKIHQPN